MLIAIPSDTNEGLEAKISEHFGHCAAFTLVAVDDGAIGDVSVLENGGHAEGGCMAPVNLLKSNGVDVLIAGGMGMRPLSGFQQVGIEVRSKEQATTVEEAVRLFLAGNCREFGTDHTCGGGEGGCGGHDHDHHPPKIQTVPIDGPADVREGRLITVDYVLKDTDGHVLENSENTGPLQFIFGAHQVLPSIERAVEGLEAEARVVQEVPVDEAFGPRDEARVFEVQRSHLPADISVGDIVAGQDQAGRHFPMTVLSLGDETAQLDSNHPFAGKDLVFELTVTKVEGIQSE